MYRVDRNNFFEKEKKATIYTPSLVSNKLFEILSPSLTKDSLILDPCCGEGSLLNPFKENDFEVLGVDIEDQGFDNTLVANFLELTKESFPKNPDLIICNPPFNLDIKTKEWVKNNYKGRPLMPEVFLQKIIELFGKDSKIVLFAPYGFRLNISRSSKRWQMFANGDYPEISSIVSLPKDCFEGVLFHSEILMFNIKEVKPHYFI